MSQREISFCKCQGSSTTFRWLIIWRHKLKLSYIFFFPPKVFNMPDWSGPAVICASEPRHGDGGEILSNVRSQIPPPSLYMFLSISASLSSLFSVISSSISSRPSVPLPYFLSLLRIRWPQTYLKLHIIDWNKRNRWCHDETDLLFKALWITGIWRKKGFLRHKGWR